MKQEQNEREKQIEWISSVVDVAFLSVAISRVLIHREKCSSFSILSNFLRCEITLVVEGGAALGFPLRSAFRCARLSAALGFPLRSAFRCARFARRQLASFARSPRFQTIHPARFYAGC